MNPRLAAWLTRAHGARWRRRFGAEFCALLEELPANPATLTNACFSALRSRARAAAGAIVAITIGASLLEFALIRQAPHRPAHAAAPTAVLAVPRAALPCDHPSLAWLTRASLRRCATA